MTNLASLFMGNSPALIPQDTFIDHAVVLASIGLSNPESTVGKRLHRLFAPVLGTTGRSLSLGRFGIVTLG